MLLIEKVEVMGDKIIAVPVKIINYNQLIESLMLNIVGVFRV